MAYYEGETLKERIERGPLALDEAVDIATQVGRGLAEAHGLWIDWRERQDPSGVPPRDPGGDYGLGGLPSTGQH